MMNMGETKYYCHNCGAQVMPTDTTCPKCGKNLSQVGKRIEKTISDTTSLADSVQTISTITGSLAEAYNQLSGTFNVHQKNIADSYNLGSNFETLKSIAESEKEQIRLMEQQRRDAVEDAKRQKRFFYISTAIAVVAVIVAVVAVIVTMLR